MLSFQCDEIVVAGLQLLEFFLYRFGIEGFSVDLGALEVNFLFVFLDFLLCFFILRVELLDSLRQ